MRKRLIQIFGFLISSLGWLFVLCTIGMDFWKISPIGGQGGSFVIKVAWYSSSLWKDCYTDSTSVMTCRDFPVLRDFTPFIHGVQGLLMCGLVVGLIGVVLCFVGMECTYIGGADNTKDKLLFAGAVFHIVGGVSDVSAYCLYINRIARKPYAANIASGDIKSDLGIPIFLGLVGCLFILLGAVLYAVTVYRVLCPESEVDYAYGGGKYMAPRSRERTLYTGYYKSRQNGSYMGSGPSTSSKISKLSQTRPTKISERDAFV
ncbi:claudin-10 [Etheostoma cragini]|uniref:claudin-10 n=1 Tax=Etheostoma cragini TaxID=417921 RepID=UPI00155F4A60|nr:claudin-10 [Etheostoma cragini]